MVRTLADAVDTAIGQVLPARGQIGVACSGGADSMALAAAAIAVAPGRIVVVTIDHRLSAGSAEVASGVAAWATARGAVAEIRAVDVADTASIEAAAREARYAALDAAISAHQLAAMWLGHTRRDQAETVLMRIVRGTGPAGLAGIPAHRGPYVRPLLALPRAATEAYVAAHGLPTWPDPMNDDRDLARVRVREHLLPLLREENPSIDDALVRLAASSREWLEAIDSLAEPFAAFPIRCAALAEQPAAIRKRALARALDRTELGYDAVHLDALDALVRAPTRGEVSIDLIGGRVVRSYDMLAPATEVTREPLVAPPGYTLRAWQRGDRMRPARLGGHSRKLSDLYGDAKVPRHARTTARVLVRLTDDAIVWAEHIGVAFGEPADLVAVQTAGSFRTH
ncbi:MAG TPA: tRNA lysidine(34) synthetase TilS [Kofleriaceae bacterium]|jgi:tRNA(Ile)-lysidine synthase